MSGKPLFFIGCPPRPLLHLSTHPLHSDRHSVRTYCAWIYEEWQAVVGRARHDILEVLHDRGNLPMATPNPPRKPDATRNGSFDLRVLGPNFGHSQLVPGLTPSPFALMGATPLADMNSIYDTHRFTATLIPRLWLTFDFRDGHSVHYIFLWKLGCSLASVQRRYSTRNRLH